MVNLTVCPFPARSTDAFIAIQKILQKHLSSVTMVLYTRGIFQLTLQVAPFLQGFGKHSLMSMSQFVPV